MSRVLIICLAISLFPLTAMAEQAQDECEDNIENCTTYSFEDEDVEGGVVGPNGERLTAGPPMRRESLIQVREHFIDMMLKSVEQL